MIRRPPRSTLSSSSAASDVYKRQEQILANQRNYKRPRKGELRYKTAEAFIKDHRSKTKAVTRRRRNSKIPTDDYMRDAYNDQLMFVVRVRGMNALEPKAKRALKKLRLLDMNNGVFMKADKASAELLRSVDPYVSFGYPSASMVEELIFKRGFGCVDKRRVALNDNKLVEQALGEKTGMICVEDIVHQIAHVGDHFQEAAQFLWPFKLNSVKNKPTNEDPDKRRKTVKVFGNQKEKINEIIQAML
eukprot:TRINITY_DN17222_c0_g1_i3.p1 TRINITY_DN17222_c0_g1~~TRINITY_DN17222_c0_g1_i3.p1  ORF type:complete len:246 (+),score=76.28 TRINITY_DN17222_c0_g1_i3:106-843(+)